MNGVIVVVAYRPKPGKNEELLQLVRSRVPTLRKEGLVTDRVPTIMRSRDGTIVEVSEWKSREAIDAAHKNPSVLAMWEKFFAVSDCVPSTRFPKPPTCSPASRRSKIDAVRACGPHRPTDSRAAGETDGSRLEMPRSSDTQIHGSRPDRRFSSRCRRPTKIDNYRTGVLLRAISPIAIVAKIFRSAPDVCEHSPTEFVEKFSR